MLGSPGSGKGTQAAVLARELSVAHISTGEIFRQNIKDRTELGMKVKQYTETGELVPDSIVIAIVADRLGRDDCRTAGFILDGFPRTVPQAAALDEWLEKEEMPLSRVLELRVERDILMRRLTGRRHCAICRIDYNIVFKPPRTEGRCDKCGGALVLRADDSEESIARRLDVDAAKTRPLHQYYEEKNLLTTVDGSKEVTAITVEILEKLGRSVASASAAGRAN